MSTKPRPRKPISAARIRLRYWFRDEAAYRAFYSIPFGRKSRSVSDREWSDTYVHGDGHIEAVFTFTHTCRNDGAQRGDSEKFFRAVCNAAGLDESRARLLDVELISREKFTEPTVPAVAPPTPAIDPPATGRAPVPNLY